MGIFSAIILFKPQRNPLLLLHRLLLFPTFFINKKRWENKKNVKNVFYIYGLYY